MCVGRRVGTRSTMESDTARAVSSELHSGNPDCTTDRLGYGSRSSSSVYTPHHISETSDGTTVAHAQLAGGDLAAAAAATAQAQGSRRDGWSGGLDSAPGELVPQAAADLLKH